MIYGALLLIGASRAVMCRRFSAATMYTKAQSLRPRPKTLHSTTWKRFRRTLRHTIACRFTLSPNLHPRNEGIGADGGMPLQGSIRVVPFNPQAKRGSETHRSPSW